MADEDETANISLTPVADGDRVGFWYTDARFAGKNVPDRRYVKEQTDKDSK